MSSARAVAETLRALLRQLPKDVVGLLDSDIATIIELFNETLTGSRHQHELITEAHSQHSALVESLYRSLHSVAQAIDHKAAQLASPDALAGTAIPPEVSRKVQELRGQPPPTTSDKDINNDLRQIHKLGWGLEKTPGGHIKIWGPAGQGPFVVSSTPSGPTSARKLRALIADIRKNNQESKNK